MPHILPISTKNKHTSELIGKKAYHLSILSSKIKNIPKGFAITAEAFEEILTENNIKDDIESHIKTINEKSVQSIEQASRTIQALILNMQINDDIKDEIAKHVKMLKTTYVAIRSSALCEDSAEDSWAGQLESYLSIPKEDVFPYIKKCWASFFAPRALMYRFKNKPTQSILAAVIIQEMIPAQVSGITFTVHPITENKDQMVTEAGWGLGAALASGEITPDNYIVSKESGESTQTTVNKQEKALVQSYKGGTEWLTLPKSKQEKQILNKQQITLISAMAQEAEKLLGLPLEIEWAIKGDKIYVLQARPITTLSQN